MSTKSLSRVSNIPTVFDEFFKPWNQWFDGNGGKNSGSVPAVNVSEDKDKYLVTLAAPGMNKADFRIDVDGNMLTISAEKEDSSEEKAEKYTRKEYSYSSFSRSFSLPDDVKQEDINAKYTDGELILQLPRKEEAKKALVGKSIPVN